MPELPEVETIKRGLEKKIIGLKIKTIQILSPKSFIGNPKILQGKKVLNIRRFAKLLVIDLVGDFSLLIHLKMSGQIIYTPSVILSVSEESLTNVRRNSNKLRDSSPSVQNDTTRFVGGHPTLDMFGELPNKHTRAIFTLSDNSQLFFNDQRKFGWIKTINNDQLTINNFFKNLGPEPLATDFSIKVFKKNLLRHPSQPVKVAILDQTVISGVGNIYACEACFLAGIDPRKKVKDLSEKEIKKLAVGIIQALKTGIEKGGSTLSLFVDADGKKGQFLDYADVYNRAGQACKKCGTVIEKIRLGGRGTFFCSNCQN